MKEKQKTNTSVTLRLMRPKERRQSEASRIIQTRGEGHQNGKPIREGREKLRLKGLVVSRDWFGCPLYGSLPKDFKLGTTIMAAS